MNHDANATEDDGSCQYMETVPAMEWLFCATEPMTRLHSLKHIIPTQPMKTIFSIQQAIIALDFKLSGMLECERSCLTHTT